ncbi:hypothetical protein D3C71_1945600 [compost metagenome]
MTFVHLHVSQGANSISFGLGIPIFLCEQAAIECAIWFIANDLLGFHVNSI